MYQSTPNGVILLFLFCCGSRVLEHFDDNALHAGIHPYRASASFTDFLPAALHIRDRVDVDARDGKQLPGGRTGFLDQCQALPRRRWVALVRLGGFSLLHETDTERETNGRYKGKVWGCA